MLHKFKIGQTVNYHPKDRMLSTARGTYTVTGLMPALEGQQREYRIRHFSEEFERVRVRERTFRGALAWPKMMTQGDELKGTYATRAEARRRQQQLEGQQAAGSGPVRHFIIKDNLDRVVI